MNANEKIGTIITTIFEKLGRENCTLTFEKGGWQVAWEDGPTKVELERTVKAALPNEATLEVEFDRCYSTKFMYAVRETAAFVTGDPTYGQMGFNIRGFTPYPDRGPLQRRANLLQKFTENMDAPGFMKVGPVHRAHLMDQALAILQAPEEPAADPDLARTQALINADLASMPDDLLEATS